MKKTCFKCGKERPFTAFYKHPRMADGRLNKCKDCTKADMREHRFANIDRIREYDRQRGLLPHRKEANKRRAKKYVEKKRQWVSEYQASHPEVRKAHIIVGNAIRDGKLKPEPCTRCGFAIGVQAHHEDYSKPLDVMWLCTKCHGARHREINEERRRSAA
jgi:hypothetical protein